jgi:O-antigen ligase
LAPLAILIFGGGLQGFRRTVVLVPMAIGSVILAFAFGGSAGLNTEVAQERLFTTRAAIESPEKSGSLQDRFAQSKASWELFKSAPITGVGPGGLIGWYTPGGTFRSAFTVDSTVSTLAKFGIVGALGVLVFLGMCGGIVRRAGKRVEHATLVGLAAWGSAYVVLSNPLEDKGLAMGLIFVLALALRHAQEQTLGVPSPVSGAVAGQSGASRFG